MNVCTGVEENPQCRPLTIEKGTQFILEDCKKSVGRKCQPTEELVKKGDSKSTSRTIVNRVKEQEKAIAMLSKDIHLGGKNAFLQCLSISFSAKSSSQTITPWDGTLCSEDLFEVTKRAKTASTSQEPTTVHNKIITH